MPFVLLLAACSPGSYLWSGGGARYSTGHNFVVIDTAVADTGDTGDTGGPSEGRCGAFNGVADPEDPGDEGAPDLLAIDATLQPAGSDYGIEGRVDVVSSTLIGGALCLRLNGEDGSETFTSREISEPGDVSDESRQAAYEDGELTFQVGNLVGQNYAVGAQVADNAGLVSDYVETNVSP